MSPGPRKAAPAPAAKPLKRPSQARARFTVQAIYDAFVRIWQRDGWDALTTRAVALETGIAVGTLYDYFPNKAALLSGYVRHSLEALVQAIDEQAAQAAGLDWQARVRTLVRLTCGVNAPELPWFDAGMLALEAGIAEPKHHRRAFEELCAAWGRVLAACTDLRGPPTLSVISPLVVAVWGGRRYALLLGLEDTAAREWAAAMENLCLSALAPTQPIQASSTDA
ncbi:MAG: TetR/AcrR family transcriptional regulator [Ramlibacter sp.]|nr:TetR/AcrR family transcriptional regulator [Ramlibacter sp.]